MGEIMPTKKKEVTKKEVAEKYITEDDFNNLLDVIEEMQENLHYINDKVARIIDRMGLNI
tara:strand:+ start:476 stop:655 length:180 start_codon:yes stop_codon:yes gene_type:complete